MKNAKTSKNEKLVKNITNSANQKRQTSNQKRAKTFRKAQTRRRPLGSKTSWKNVETKNEPGEAFWACQTTPSTSSSPLITRNNSIMTKKKNENKNVIKNAKTSKHQKYQKRHKKRQQKRDTKHDEHHKSRKIVKSSNTPNKRSKKRNNNKKTDLEKCLEPVKRRRRRSAHHPRDGTSHERYHRLPERTKARMDGRPAAKSFTPPSTVKCHCLPNNTRNDADSSPWHQPRT